MQIVTAVPQAETAWFHNSFQEGIIQAEKQKVQRGIAWLDKHAKPGWILNLFSCTSDGQLVLMAQNQTFDYCVLALAFRKDQRFAPARKPTNGDVCRFFCTWSNSMSHNGF